MDAKTPGQVINGLKAGKFAKLCKIAPAGSLEARKLTTGTMLYWRVTLDGKTNRAAIGLYDSSAPPKSIHPTVKGYSVQAAVRAAEVLASSHQANIESGGHRALVESQREARRQAEAQKQEAAKYTLQNLLDSYCDYQKSIGRTSYKDALSIFKLHISDAWPKIAAMPANQVTPEQVADMMRRLIGLGKGRTANKLRTYLSAAYGVAKAARTKPSIPVHFKGFRVGINPAAETVPDEASNRDDKNPLTAAELRTYWKAIKTLPGLRGAALRLHLLTGGQRIAQLVRLKTSDVSDEAILLWDGKGRPGRGARPHTLPLVPAAVAALKVFNPQGVYALSTDGGVTHLAPTTLSRWAVKAAVAIPDFDAKRIRSGVETLLASSRIGNDIRGRLQSHGISGVQNRHYDGYEYLDEKLHAMQTLYNLLEAPEASNVVQFKAA